MEVEQQHELVVEARLARGKRLLGLRDARQRQSQELHLGPAGQLRLRFAGRARPCVSVLTVCVISDGRLPSSSVVSMRRAHQEPAASTKSSNRVAPVTLSLYRSSIDRMTCRAVSMRMRVSYCGLEGCLRTSSVRSLPCGSRVGV